MSYSCSDFTDTILDALDIELDEDDRDYPAGQADLCLDAIAELKRKAGITDQAIKLLRKLQADIGAMRVAPKQFGGFQYEMDYCGEVANIEWANLDILLNEIDAVLKDAT